MQYFKLFLLFSGVAYGAATELPAQSKVIVDDKKVVLEIEGETAEILYNQLEWGTAYPTAVSATRPKSVKQGALRCYWKPQKREGIYQCQLDVTASR